MYNKIFILRHVTFQVIYLTAEGRM